MPYDDEIISDEEWVIEHSWICVTCRTENPSHLKKCENCGKPQDASDQEIVPTDLSKENAVTDSETLKKFGNGADYFCGFCGSRQADIHGKCVECAGPQSEKKSNFDSNLIKSRKTIIDSDGIKVQQIELTDEAKEALSTSAAKQTSKSVISEGFRQSTFEVPLEEAKPVFDQAISKLKKNAQTIGLVSVGVTGFFLFIWLMIYLFSSHETNARVSRTRWQYHISLHARQIMNGHDWRESMHSHAFNATCSTQIRSHHDCDPYQCNPHQEGYRCRCERIPHTDCSPDCSTTCTNQNNGSTRCRRTCRRSCTTTYTTSCDICYRTVMDRCWHSCPDYDQICDYQYPGWPEINQATTSNIDHIIVRPDIAPESVPACIGDNENLYIQQNATQCTESTMSYDVQFDAGNTGHWSIQPSSLGEYNRYQTGNLWRVEYNHAGSFRPLHRVQ
jgi:hypothetical protein